VCHRSGRFANRSQTRTLAPRRRRRRSSERRPVFRRAGARIHPRRIARTAARVLRRRLELMLPAIGRETPERKRGGLRVGYGHEPSRRLPRRSAARGPSTPWGSRARDGGSARSIRGDVGLAALSGAPGGGLWDPPRESRGQHRIASLVGPVPGGRADSAVLVPGCRWGWIGPGARIRLPRSRTTDRTRRRMPARGAGARAKLEAGEDATGHPRVGERGDHAHAAAARRAFQHLDCEDKPQELGPGRAPPEGRSPPRVGPCALHAALGHGSRGSSRRLVHRFACPRAWT